MVGFERSPRCTGTNVKIMVTGNAGAGKTTVSSALATMLGIPRVNLDGVVWRQRWRKAPPAERDARIAEIIGGDSWVVDGVSSAVLQAADLVVFLDVSRRRCLRRAVRRNAPYLFRSRPELPARCPEILVVPTLLRIIWRFDRHVRPAILAEAALRSDDAFLHLEQPAPVHCIVDMAMSRALAFSDRLP